MIDWVCDNWDQPDEGIWETRGGARTSPTHGSRSGSRWTGPPGWPRRGRPANVQRWTTERDRVYNQIIERGWNPTTRALTQHYTTEVLDSCCGPAGHCGYAPRAMARWRPTRDVEWQLKSYCDRRIPGHDPLSASRVAGGRPIGGPAP